MTKDEIFEKVKQITSEVVGRTGRRLDSDKIQLDSRFIDDLGLSSIAVLELIMALEDAYDLEETPEKVIMNIQTVDETVKYLMTVL